MDKYEIAQVLREIGMLVELTEPNPKKGIAYQRAATTIESIPCLEKVIQEDSFESLPYIGMNMSKMIHLLIKNGSIPYQKMLQTRIPEPLLSLSRIPGLRLNKIRILYETFGIGSIDDLETLFKNNPKIKGFGPSFIYKMLLRIAKIKKEGLRFLYPKAYYLAQMIQDISKGIVDKMEIAGDLRRKCEVISQLDFVAVPKDPKEFISFFSNHGLIEKVLHKNEHSIQVLLKQGILLYIQLCTKKDYVYQLHQLTGNHKHLEQLPLIPQQCFRNEHALYRHLEMPFILPELREGKGELEAAKKNCLPQLIEEKDLKGTFHCHTLDSDGSNTIEELAAAAKKLKWEYLGIADHSKSSYQANGMNEERLFAQIEKIKNFNKKKNNPYIFSGLECDILKDGELDFPNEILKELDYVIVSIHRYFNLDEPEMTRRLIKAIENPYTTMIGHLTGRLLTFREPYQLDIPKVIDACIANQKIIEINGTPSRMELDWRWWIKAKEKGLKCVINPDAHSLRDLKNCAYGIQVARKGWLERKDVINTFPLSQIKNYLNLANNFF